MAGDIKLKLGTDAAFAMTGSEDVDSSSTWVVGWTSTDVDNTSTLAIDYLVSGQFTTEASNRQAGWIYVYAYGAFDDTPTWPDLFSSGTEGSVGAGTVQSAEARDAGIDCSRQSTATTLTRPCSRSRRPALRRHSVVLCQTALPFGYRQTLPHRPMIGASQAVRRCTTRRYWPSTKRNR